MYYSCNIPYTLLILRLLDFDYREEYNKYIVLFFMLQGGISNETNTKEWYG